MLSAILDTFYDHLTGTQLSGKLEIQGVGQAAYPCVTINTSFFREGEEGRPPQSAAGLPYAVVVHPLYWGSTDENADNQRSVSGFGELFGIGVTITHTVSQIPETGFYQHFKDNVQPMIRRIRHYFSRNSSTIHGDINTIIAAADPLSENHLLGSGWKDGGVSPFDRKVGPEWYTSDPPATRNNRAYGRVSTIRFTGFERLQPISDLYY